MKDKDLNNLGRLVKKVGGFKPKEPPKKPDHQPNNKELETKYKLNLKTLELSEH